MAPGTTERASQWNMESVGHNDLQGRSAYQPIIINQDGRQIAYVGHHNNQKPLMNPLNGKVEVNGTSIVDVTDPANTKYLAHIRIRRGPRCRWLPDGSRVQRQHAAACREGQMVPAASAWWAGP